MEIIRNDNIKIHINIQDDILLCFKNSRMNISAVKCEWKCDSFSCIGFVVAQDRINSDTSKVRLELGIKPPKKQKIAKIFHWDD